MKCVQSVVAVWGVAVAVGSWGCGGNECTAVTVPAEASLQEAAQQILDVCIVAEGAPSGVLAIAQGDELAVAVSGPADGDGAALRPDHLIRVGSVTKTFTAALVLALADKGLLSLDDRVEQHVAGLPNGSTLTLEHLLRMTSGWANYTDVARFKQEMDREWTAEELLEVIRAEGTKANPGETFAYNNSNYFVLGLVVEKVTGTSFDQALLDHLLTPAGVADEAMMEGAPRFDASRLAQGFQQDGSLVEKGIHPSAVFAAGAMTITPAAFLRFTAHLEHDLLSEDSLTRMRTPGPVQDFFIKSSGEEYAMGHWRQELSGVELFGHPGGHPSGAAARWFTAPSKDIRVLAQFNTAQANARDTAEAAMRVTLERASR